MIISLTECRVGTYSFALCTILIMLSPACHVHAKFSSGFGGGGGKSIVKKAKKTAPRRGHALEDTQTRLRTSSWLYWKHKKLLGHTVLKTVQWNTATVQVPYRLWGFKMRAKEKKEKTAKKLITSTFPIIYIKIIYMGKGELKWDIDTSLARRYIKGTEYGVIK